MSRVLLVTTNYWPEPTGIAVYTADLAEALKNNECQVTVLTSLPHYPWWKVPSEFAHLGDGAGGGAVDLHLHNLALDDLALFLNPVVKIV